MLKLYWVWQQWLTGYSQHCFGWNEIGSRVGSVEAVQPVYVKEYRERAKINLNCHLPNVTWFLVYMY
jgi:hypothetical protein